MAAKRKPNLGPLLARNLRRVREAQGLSQQDLADIAGVTQGAVSGIENNLRNPSMGMIALLAHALKVPGRELFKEEKR